MVDDYESVYRRLIAAAPRPRERHRPRASRSATTTTSSPPSVAADCPSSSSSTTRLPGRRPARRLPPPAAERVRLLRGGDAVPPPPRAALPRRAAPASSTRASSEDAAAGSPSSSPTPTCCAIAAGCMLPGRSLRIARRLSLYGGSSTSCWSLESFARGARDVVLSLRSSRPTSSTCSRCGASARARGARCCRPGVDEADGVGSPIAGSTTSCARRSSAFDPAPGRLDADGADYRLAVLAPGPSVELTVSARRPRRTPAPVSMPLGDGDALRRRRAATEPLERGGTAVAHDHDLFDRWVARSRRDLHLLLTETPDGFVPYAGIPWYVAPFGRDASSRASRSCPSSPSIAAGHAALPGPPQSARGRRHLHRPGAGQDRSTSTGGARWRPAARSRSSPTTAASTRRRSSSCCWRSTSGGRRTPVRARAVAGRRARARLDAGATPTPTARLPHLPAALAAWARQPGLEGLPRRHHARRRASWPSAPDRARRGAGLPLRGAAGAPPARRARRGAPERAPRSGERAPRLRDGSSATSGWRTRPSTRWPSTARAQPCRVVTSNPGHCLWTRHRRAQRARAVVGRA